MRFFILIVLLLITCTEKNEPSNYNISFVDEKFNKRAGELFDVKINVDVNNANKQGEDFIVKAGAFMYDEASDSRLQTGGWHEVDKQEGGEITIKNVFFTNSCNACQVTAKIVLADCREETRKKWSDYGCEDETISETTIPAVVSENPWSVTLTKDGDRGIAIQVKKDGHLANNQQLTIMAGIDSFSKNINKDLLPDFKNEREAWSDTFCNKDLWQSSGYVYRWLLADRPIFAGQPPPSCRCAIDKQTITTDNEGRWYGEVAQYITDNCWIEVQLTTEEYVLLNGKITTCSGEAPHRKCMW